MEDHPQKPNQAEGNVSKKQFVPVKSKYLDFTKKSPSQPDVTGPSTMAAARSMFADSFRAPTSKAVAKSTLALNTSRACVAASSSNMQRPVKSSKTSTPVKDVSFVSAGHKPECRKVKEEILVESCDDAFIEYNKCLLLQALKVIVDERTTQFAEAADTQLSMLQKAVDDSASLIDDLNLQIDTATSLDDIQEDVALATEAYKQVVGEPAFSNPTSFEEITAELNGVLDQLPCKNMRVPTSQQDFDEIAQAALTLANTLTGVLQKNGEEFSLTSGINEELSKLESICNSLEEANASIKELMPIASSKVLDETAKCTMSSVLGNAGVKF